MFAEQTNKQHSQSQDATVLLHSARVLGVKSHSVVSKFLHQITSNRISKQVHARTCISPRQLGHVQPEERNFLVTLSDEGVEKLPELLMQPEHPLLCILLLRRAHGLVNT
eukprot:438938-Hanusia_phi.AAC.1